jgi:hypothetical protein
MNSRLGIYTTRHLRYYDYIPYRLVQFHETRGFDAYFQLFPLTDVSVRPTVSGNGQNRETRAFRSGNFGIRKGYPDFWAQFGIM